MRQPRCSVLQAGVHTAHRRQAGFVLLSWALKVTEPFGAVGEAEWAQLESPDPTCLVSISTARH